MYAFRNVVAESFAAVLHTTVADPYKDGEMWRLLLDTASVDGVLNSAPPMDKIIHEMILAWNHADTWQKRIQILSMYSTRLSFSQLKGYNHPSVSPNQTGERAAVLDQDADGDGAPIVDPAAGKSIYFNPALTYHTHRQSRMHYHNNNAGGAPLVRCKSYIWKIPLETIDAIIDFIASPLNIQNVSLSLVSFPFLSKNCWLGCLWSLESKGPIKQEGQEVYCKDHQAASED